MKCWEFRACGVKEKCPAYPNHGNRCARVAGTLCNGKVQGKFASKLADCMKCPFYESEFYEKMIYENLKEKE